MYPRVNIEETFAELVREHGGVVLEDKLPKSPTFENADYVFHFEKVVAELKCLTEDNLGSSNNQAKIEALMVEWYGAGKTKTPIMDESSWRDMPKELQTRVIEISTKSIRRRIQKANRQIRETKEALRLKDYSGLVILANDGIESLSPAAFIHAAQHSLSRNFSEIQYFIYMTANLFTNLRETPMPTLFWIGFDMEKGEKMDAPFVDRLGRNWRRLVCRKTGIPGFEQELQDMEGFWHAQHVR